MYVQELYEIITTLKPFAVTYQQDVNFIITAQHFFDTMEIKQVMLAQKNRQWITVLLQHNHSRHAHESPLIFH